MKYLIALSIAGLSMAAFAQNPAPKAWTIAAPETYDTAKQRDLGFAKRVAGDMYDRARFKEELGIPQSVKRFSNAADACMKQLDREIEQGLKPRTNLTTSGSFVCTSSRSLASTT